MARKGVPKLVKRGKKVKIDDEVKEAGQVCGGEHQPQAKAGVACPAPEHKPAQLRKVAGTTSNET